MPRETSEEERCDNFVRSVHGEIFPFSMRGESPFPNVSDRRYYVRGVAFWFEVKVSAISATDAKRLGW